VARAGRLPIYRTINQPLRPKLVDHWVALIGLEPNAFGTHTLRRTKVALVYKKTGNLRACQLLLGHRKLESTVRYLGIEVDDALALSEQVDL
jgi:integrase